MLAGGNIFSIGERELAYGTFHENSSIARASHPPYCSRLRPIPRLHVEDFAYRFLGVVRPRESHEIRPRVSTSNGRL